MCEFVEWGWPENDLFKGTVSVILNDLYKGTVSVISNDPPCKDGNEQFTTIPLNTQSDQKCFIFSFTNPKRLTIIFSLFQLRKKWASGREIKNENKH